MNTMSDDEVPELPPEPETDFGRLHESCINAVDGLLRFAKGEIPFGEGVIESGDEAVEILSELSVIASEARYIRHLLGPIEKWLQNAGLTRGWDFEVDGEHFSSAHVGLARFLGNVFVRSLNASEVFGQFDDRDSPGVLDIEHFIAAVPYHELDDAAAIDRIEKFLGARPIVEQINRHREKWPRLRLVLQQEALALGHAPLTGDYPERLLIYGGLSRRPKAKSSTPSKEPAGEIIVDHRVRRIRSELVDDGSLQLMPRQMDLILLLALARKRNEWVRTVDLKKTGAIGNPSEMLRRLPATVRALVESSKKGWRLRVGCRVIHEQPLTCGRRIDWSTLEVVERSAGPPR